jgi:hypothetical protein
MRATLSAVAKDCSHGRKRVAATSAATLRDAVRTERR